MVGRVRFVFVAIALVWSGFLAWPAVQQTRAVPYERRVSTPEFERKEGPVFQRIPPEERRDWILAIWDDAAKAEFWVLSGTAGAWMLLPKLLRGSKLS